ncbi:hypothetical protein ACHAAC_15505 [Aeromicrobium sp. CF4.19]|uniref:hypothetical protein n=1 Tax=Aeromicrobium sp. CF4.19 TaxID=3373082 RepID=UPI003EE50954
MSRLIRLSSVLAVTALVLTACTEAENAEPESEPTPTESGETAATNACELVPQDLLDRVNPRDAEPVSRLLLGDLTYDGCTIGGVYDVSFGVRIADDGKELSELVPAGTEPAEEVDLGDEGFRSVMQYDGEVVEVNYVVRFADHVVRVENSSLGNDDEADHVSQEDTKALLVALGEAVPDDYEQEALTTSVDEACLPADDPSILDLVGEVQLARSAVGDDTLRCNYLAADFTRLEFTMSDTTDVDEPFRAETAGQDAEEIEVEGVAAAALIENDLEVAVVVQPDQESIARLSVQAPDLRDPEPDAEGAIEVAKAFLAAD